MQIIVCSAQEVSTPIMAHVSTAWMPAANASPRIIVLYVMDLTTWIILVSVRSVQRTVLFVRDLFNASPVCLLILWSSMESVWNAPSLMRAAWLVLPCRNAWLVRKGTRWLLVSASWMSQEGSVQYILFLSSLCLLLLLLLLYLVFGLVGKIGLDMRLQLLIQLSEQATMSYHDQPIFHLISQIFTKQL